MNDNTIFVSVFLLNAFAYLTIRLRPLIYGVKVFKPMLWNFKLSLLPFVVLSINMIVFITLLALSANTGLNWLGIIGYIQVTIGMILWLLILPNSGYLITELNLTHRNEDTKPVPIWYDIVSVLSFALSGIINTIANIVLIQILYLVFTDPETITSNVKSNLWILAVVLNLLVAIGVYLGRSIRFNSWDILHPTSFIKKLIEHFKIKGTFKDFTLFVTFHTIFFMIMYVVLGVNEYFQ